LLGSHLLSFCADRLQELVNRCGVNKPKRLSHLVTLLGDAVLSLRVPKEDFKT
jgi:hypothetical protein